MKFLRLMAAQ
jgi:hypothetical protein